MLMKPGGQGCPNSTGEELSCSKPSLVLKGQPYFLNISLIAKSKSVLTIWSATNEKLFTVKSNILVFIDEQDRMMGLVIHFIQRMFYRLSLSTFLLSEEVRKQYLLASV